VVLFARDLDRGVEFYTAALGLRAVEREDGWVALDAGGVRLALHAIPRSIASSIEISSPPRARTDTPLKLVFEVEDLGAAASLPSFGGTVLRRASDGSCDALDPEGNVFRIAPAGGAGQRRL